MKLLDKNDVQCHHKNDEDRFYVDADIAQEMYNVLFLIDNDEGSNLSGIAWDRLQQALEKADKD